MTKKPLALLLFVVLLSLPALAVPKEIIALQQQVALLMAEMQDLQKSVTANAAVMKTLVGQNADSIAQMQTGLKSLQQTVNAQIANSTQNQNQLGQQFQNLSDAIGDLQARMNKVNEVLTQIQQAQQTLTAPQTAPANGTTPTTPGNASVPGATNTPTGQTPPGQTAGGGATPVLPAAILYRNAISDYVNGSYPLAASEFQTFIAAYPSDAHATDANYYLGDILMKENKYSDAIQSFDAVINSSPDSQLGRGAQLKKGYSLLALRQRAAGIRELRNLISHYPSSAEAQQAKDELTTLNVSVRSE